MTEKKKLIEVALPLEAINIACKADKDRKTGSIRNLHKWFAPMPVPALRAMIFAALVDDPGDGKRADYLKLIEDLVASVVDQPPAATLSLARKLIADSFDGEPPPVFDPFCGGGSTLVEAQRLGLRAVGSDLNPIPVLISRVLAEYPPSLRQVKPVHPDAGRDLLPASGLPAFVADVRRYADDVARQAQRALGEFYPIGPNGDPVIAWWWARTVPSPDPRFEGAPTPLVNDWWLCRKPGAEAYAHPVVDRDSRTISYEIRSSGDPIGASKSRCLFSGAPISYAYVREQALSGRLGTTMVAVITHGSNGRQHFAATAEQVSVALRAQPRNPPREPLPDKALSFSVQGYGLRYWSELFTARQLLSLETFAQSVRELPSVVIQDGGSREYATAIASVLGLCVGKLAQFNSTLASWYARKGTVGKAERAFARHDVSMTWDFPEVNPFAGGVGNWRQIVDTTLRAFEFVSDGPPAQVLQADARTAASTLQGTALVVTDPPYFSSIGYADLSDYFFVWIRRALRDLFPDEFGTLLTPKQGELIAAPARHKSREEARDYFVEGFTETFRSLRRVSRPDLPLLVVYAFKEQDAPSGRQAASGWEAMLSALLAGGLAIVGTWPIRGTGTSRMISAVQGGTNSLATYVLLVCRERPATAVRTTRRDFLAELRASIRGAVTQLQVAAVAPVDLAQSVIGPGMAVFSKYESVIEADGSAMSVHDALLAISSALAEVLDEQEHDFDPATRWALTWSETHGFSPGEFGQADALARSKVTTVDALVRAGVVKSGGGKVQLLSRTDLPEDWTPQRGSVSTVWEAVQHLIVALDRSGEFGASDLLRVLGPKGDAARELAYLLYAQSERQGRTRDAVAYNALVVAWPEVARIASAPSALTQDRLL